MVVTPTIGEAGGSSAAGITSAAVRSELVSALKASLVGPLDASGEEVLSNMPTRRYLTGFIVPDDDKVREVTPGEDEDDVEEQDEVETDDQGAIGNLAARGQKRFLPSSIGLSFLLSQAAKELTLNVTYAQYEPVLPPGENEEKKRPRWRRIPREGTMVASLEALAREGDGLALPNHPGVFVVAKLEPVTLNGRALQSVSLFVVNRKSLPDPSTSREREAATLFQVELHVSCTEGIEPRDDRTGEVKDDADARQADVQFRNVHEYAVGHIAAAAEVPRASSRDAMVTEVRSTFLPTYEVPRVVARTMSEGDPSVVFAMQSLAKLGDAGEVTRALGGLVEGYRVWLKQQAAEAGALDSAARKEAGAELIRQGEVAAERIEEGIKLLCEDAWARKAFALANQAMHEQAVAANVKGPNGGPPAWRPFQLGFILLSLPSVFDAAHPDRELAELIYFPTGGGKTEAYLGVIAFTLLMRRLRGQARPDRGLGVAVMMRYTLRLLTLDQLGRATRLMCALELVRKRTPELGKERFTIGLWVGSASSPNTLTDARERQANRKKMGKADESICPIESCPWCNTPFGTTSIDFQKVGSIAGKKEEIVRVFCKNDACPFNSSNEAYTLGLPMLFVDEDIYREVPCFLIGTVDKFAMLPWRGETGKLFGRVLAHAPAGDTTLAFGPLDKTPKGAQSLPGGYLPPELIVQDELHLISGPLGTLVGLYEAAIDHLCSAPASGGGLLRAKVIASTATVKRAQAQVEALYGRQVSVFPPAGIHEGETFFGTVDQAAKGRLYLGVAAHGKPLKKILIRTYTALLAAGSGLAHKYGTEAVDPYLTLVGYFNSLRELGAMARIATDDVAGDVSSLTVEREDEPCTRHPRICAPRKLGEAAELTSRKNTAEIAEAKEMLARKHGAHGPRAVDIALASNMISVGLDITRLGLMVVAGQPKTVSEYIQASSRVGRDEKKPGLVVTCYNVARPRDRSHFENFVTMHQAFYRSVEAQSVTPFSERALDRGLAAVLVALVRLDKPAHTAGESAGLIRDIDTSYYAGLLAARVASAVRGPESDAVRRQIEAKAKHLLDVWAKSIEEDVPFVYGQWDKPSDKSKGVRGNALLKMHGAGTDDGGSLAAGTSMRDVEQSVDIWIESARFAKSQASPGSATGSES